MARTRSVVGRSVCCASLALLLSVLLFAALLHAQLRWPGYGARSSKVLTVDVDLPARVTEESRKIETVSVIADASVFVDSGDDETVSSAVSMPGIDSYLPVSQLTERPQLLRDIDAQWHLPGVSLPVVVATLLISEYGDIDRIELHGPSLSPMLEQDLRARFAAVRFTPGKLHGKPVRSALRIEIRLD